MLAAAALWGLACSGPPPAEPRLAFEEACTQAEDALAHGRLDEAQEALTYAVPLADAAGRRSKEQARVRLDLVRLHRLRGDARRARTNLALARLATRSLYGDDSLEMAEVELEESRLHQQSGLHDQAVDAVAEALRIRSERLPADDPLRIATLLELAYAHLRDLNYSRAIERYDEALDAMGDDPQWALDRVIALNRMAWIYERAALPSRATELNEQARTVIVNESPGRGRDGRTLGLGLEALTEAAPDHGDKLSDVLRMIETWISERGYHPEHFAVDRHMLVALRRLDRGVPLRKIEIVVRRDLAAEFISFAPARPRRDSQHRYGLPFASDVPREVLSTSEGAHGFDRVLLHAFDFAVPRGTRVLVAREGTIVRVVHGLPHEREHEVHAEDDLQHGDKVNKVVILHDDHSYATYQPLAPDVAVREGERVARGQLIGVTSEVSDGRPAIVHFDVRRNARTSGAVSALTAEPVRARFAEVQDRDGIPLPGHHYQGPAVPAAPAPKPGN